MASFLHESAALCFSVVSTVISFLSVSRLMRHSRELLHFSIEMFLPSSFHRYLPKVDHFAPHQNVRFEGCFSRTVLEDGSTILVIFCGVPSAAKHPYYIHFAYHPSSSSSIEAMSINLYPDHMTASVSPPWTSDGVQPYRYSISDSTYCQFEHNKVIYRLSLPEALQVSIDITNLVPTFPSDRLQTPHGPLARLPTTFPLHWDILTPYANAQVEIKKAGVTLIKDKGISHIEKNWGLAFPSAWTWSQASLPNERGVSFVLAGGKLLGVESIMLVLRLQNGLEWNFRPPRTILLFGRFSLGYRFRCDGEKGVLDLSVNDLWRRVDVKVVAKEPVDAWAQLNTPAKDGHNNLASSQTHSATAQVTAYQRKSLFSKWQEVARESFDNAALELGGGCRVLSKVQ